MAETELFLAQRNPLGFDVQIKLVDGRELKILSKRRKVEEKYSIDILSLQQKSKEVQFTAWKWLVACVVTFLFAILSLTILPEYIGDSNELYLDIISMLIFLITFMCLVLYYKRSVKKQIFYSRITGVPVIELTAGKPSKEIFSRFINAVEKRTKKYQTHMGLTEAKQLTGEMKMLRRLSDIGVISKKSYQIAKAKLFTGLGN